MKGLLSVAVLAILSAAVPLSAGSLAPCDPVLGNLVANCGFESGDFTGWTTGGNFEDTNVVTGAFYAYSGANSGSFYAAMGPVGSDGTLSQTFSTVLGQAYTFSFYLAGVGDDVSDFTALWDGAPLLSLGDPNTGATFTQFSFSVTGTGSDSIQFNFRDDPAFLALDDVVVVPGAATSTPEPGTIGMMLTGLGAALAVRLRRRA